MDDPSKLSTDNKINRNIFVFLLRSYLTRNMDIFKILDILVKMIKGNKKKLVRIKYVTVNNKFIYIYIILIY